MRRTALAAVTLTVFLLPACTQSFTAVSRDIVVLRNYELGSVRTANVGEPIVRVQQAAEVITYVAARRYTVPGSRSSISEGMRFVAVARDAEGNLLLTNPEFDRHGQLVVSPAGSPVGWRPRDGG
jgi:hypothetical protein